MRIPARAQGAQTATGRSGRPQLPRQPERAHSATVDHYLETIYCIAGEGETVRPSRIAEWLGVSPPTVTVALRRLERDGWIAIAEDRSVRLSETGQELASQIVRRHRLLERWLTDVLGFDWATADVEADRLASAVSDEVLARLDESMHSPTTCPHGNPVPGRKPPYGKLVSLAALRPGTPARVARISEIAEHEARQLLSQLASYGVRTGTEVSVTPGRAAGESLRVAIAGETMTITPAVAEHLWVEPAGL
jgi:DtxR family Mn-dependent transcriptional regulator